jgi:hypothetical protein
MSGKTLLELDEAQTAPDDALLYMLVSGSNLSVSRQTFLGQRAERGAVEHLDHGDVTNLTIDLSDAATPGLHLARLTGLGILAIVLPTAGYRVVRLDATSTTGAHSWILSADVEAATPYAQDLDLTPPAGAGVVRSYWITAGPGRLDVSWQTVGRP